MATNAELDAEGWRSVKVSTIVPEHISNAMWLALVTDAVSRVSGYPVVTGYAVVPRDVHKRLDAQEYVFKKLGVRA